MNANGLANTADPLLLLTITDGSSSMNKEILFEKQRMSRAQALARVHNSFWSEASQSCHDNGRARSVYFFSSLRYGNGQVCPGFEGALKDQEFVSVGDLIANPLELERITPVPGEDAPVIEQPVWVKPHANGNTPTCRGFDACSVRVAKWIGMHPDGPAPVVMHTTDGESTDGDPLEPAHRLTNLRTSAGNVVLFNVSLSGEGGEPIVFPATPDRLPDAFSRRLFEMSSVLPDPMADCARRLGIQVEPGARTLICNARMRDVMRALITGSQMA